MMCYFVVNRANDLVSSFEDTSMHALYTVEEDITVKHSFFFFFCQNFFYNW